MQAQKVNRDGSLRKTPLASIDHEVTVKKVKRKKKKSYKAPTHRSSDDETDRKIPFDGKKSFTIN